MEPSPWLDVGANLFSSVGTVGAFAVAMYLLRKEHKREERHDEEARRSQAVSADLYANCRARPVAVNGAASFRTADPDPSRERRCPHPAGGLAPGTTRQPPVAGPHGRGGLTAGPELTAGARGTPGGPSPEVLLKAAKVAVGER